MSTTEFKTFGPAQGNPLSLADVPSIHPNTEHADESITIDHSMDMDHPMVLGTQNIPLLYDTNPGHSSLPDEFAKYPMPEALVRVILDHLQEPKSKAQQHLKIAMQDYQQNASEPACNTLQSKLRNDAHNVIQDIVNSLMPDIEINIRNALEAEFDQWIFAEKE